MNAFTMKLENRQQVEVQNEAKPKGISGIKKCKSLKKKNISCSNDKDASLSSHGLGRKFPEKVDLSSLNINTIAKYDCSKKIRAKKESHKIDRMCASTDRIQERLQRFLSNEDKEKILCILNDIRALTDIEKLYLYLQLPTGSPFEVDPFKQKTPNPLGKKADEEGLFAITWIQSHLEEDPDVSLPKQEVYDEYQSYCNLTGTDPLCAADFGKVMKQIFPSVKPRRLGTRGNSRYCYSGLRKKLKIAPPSVPDIQNENCSSDENFGDEVTAAACHLLFEWAEKLLGIKFNSLKELAAHLLENMYVDNRSVAAFTVLLDASPQLLTKGFSPSEGGVKKSEAQFHLHRKIQEKELIKEQKKKLQEQRSSLVGINRPKGVSPKKKSVKPRKLKLFSVEGLQHEEKIAINIDHRKTSSQKNPEEAEVRKQNENVSGNSSDILTDTDAVVDVVINEFNIKKEDGFSKSHSNEIVSCNKIIEQSLTNLVMSPLSSPSSSLGDIEDSMRKKGKILLPQNKSPVCIAQSLPGIIIVPSLPQLTTEIGKQNANTPKYKRIQPKPLQGETFNTVARSRAGSVGSSLPAKPKARNADGRRSSHAWLQSDSFIESGDEKLLQLNSANVHSLFKSVPEKNAPKNIFLKDDIRFESLHDQSDKLTVENLSSLSLSCVNIPSSEKENKRITELHMKSSHIQTLLSAETEDGNSAKRHLDEKDDHADNKRVHLDSYRLSKESSNAHSSNINISSAHILSNNQCTRLGHEEVNVHEIEGDALNDYFRGANIQSSVNSLPQNDFEQQHTTHKVKQLSQLRMLLEQNLPSAISKSTINSTKLQKVSKSVDTNENIQVDLSDSKNSHSPLLHDSNKALITNVFFENHNSSNVISDPSIKSNPQPESLEKLLSSNYLVATVEDNTDNELLSDPTLFLNCSQNSEQDMDIGLHNDLNQNSSTNDMLFSSAILSDTDFSSKGTNPGMSCNRVSACTQVPSVPQSPNTRRRAFNFMPISPRHTPIPEGIGTNGTSMSSMSPHLRTMMSTGVGPSQPPSNSGSPFVSPRSTPVPLCRSRHSSGQSTYSASRHTPFQNFDSGVSSVSSSPFISPQPTPVPVSRLRHNSSHGSSKTVTFCSINSPQVIHPSNSLPHLRTRHSSGPVVHASIGSPCNSLSPLVSEQGSTSSFVFPPGNEVRSRHNSGSNTTTPLSPVSEQASSSSSCTSNIPDLSSVSDISSSVSQSFLNDRAADLLISANPSSFKQVRHRHASSSVIYGKSSYASKDLFSQEIQKLLKNYHENGTSDVLLSNRSQSVPLHQMLQTTDSYCLLTQPVEDSCPKSHPSTPVMNQMFSFPALSSNQEVATYSLGIDVNNRDKSVVQTSQMEWTGFDGSVDLETNSARRNLTALYDAPPLSDDLQTTLEDLRDCDTDFSKLELELRQNEESGL